MTTAQLARTVEEMRFAAGLESCPGCGLHEIGLLELDGDGTHWTCRGPCPRCGTLRTFQFQTAGSPWASAIEFDELGPGASKLITAEQFLAAMRENAAGIPDDPKVLTPRQRQRLATRLNRALIASSELLKMLPPPTQPQSKNPQLQRAAVENEYKRLFKLSARYAPPNTIAVEALEAHRAWIERGAKGDDGYLKIEGKRLVGERYGSWQLSFVRIAHSDLTNVDLSLSLVNEADLEDDILTGANLGGTSFANSLIRGGTWTMASMSVANFNGVEVRGTDFSRSELDRSTWFNAKIGDARFDGVHFGNTRFDGAVFTRCSFRNASLAKYMSEPVPSSAGAQFVECDFSGTDWTDRDLLNTTFTNCTFDGARGKPAVTTGLVVTGGLDTAALLRQLV
jgi:uncharacterized protein YjbI with pentapeptide repeats